MQKKSESPPTGANEQRLEVLCEEALRQNIIEGCREMWDTNVETEREFHPLEEEVVGAHCPE